MKYYRIVFYFCLVLFSLSCSSRYYESEMEYGTVRNEMAKSARLMEAEAPMEDLAPVPLLSEPTPATDSSQSSEDASVPAQNNRMRIYNGSAGLIIDKVEETRAELEKIALDSGGYVESSYRNYVILRVPVARFTQIFEEILTLGKVSYQEISTWDVTDQFTDTKQRLETAQKTRERLYALLERSQDAKERAKILREIGRLSEEIQRISQQLQLMENRIAFSKITVNLTPKLEDDSVNRTIPFDWIASLDPLYPASDRLKAKVTLNPGDDFAVFSKEKNYLAEDAVGTTLIISTVDNTPRGDSSFWQKALVFHLTDYFESADTFSLPVGDKEFLAVRFVSKDSEPYHYITAVRAEDKDLHVLEIFSPTDKDLAPLLKALSQGEFK